VSARGQREREREAKREREREREKERALISLALITLSSLFLFFFFFSFRLTFSLSFSHPPPPYNTSTKRRSCPLGASTSAADDILLLSDVNPSGPLQRAVASSAMPDAFAVGFVKGKKEKRLDSLSLSLPPRLVLGVRSPLPPHPQAP
jgi:hypothetical protein